MLAGYSDAARRAIASEADTWFHGNVESARKMYDRAIAFARLQQDGNARRYHAWGAWHANQLLSYAAIREVMGELGESMQGEARI